MFYNTAVYVLINKYLWEFPYRLGVETMRTSETNLVFMIKLWWSIIKIYFRKPLIYCFDGFQPRRFIRLWVRCTRTWSAAVRIEWIFFFCFVSDLNYCGTHEPCLNGGTCKSTAPDRYTCTCPEGFGGANCDVVLNPCATEPCANGGKCRTADAASGAASGAASPGTAVQQPPPFLAPKQFHCECQQGWTGSTCNTGTCLQMFFHDYYYY